MKFRVYKSTRIDRWYWYLVADNGRKIADGQGYKSKAGCLKGIAAVRKCVSARIVQEV